MQTRRPVTVLLPVAAATALFLALRLGTGLLGIHSVLRGEGGGMAIAFMAVLFVGLLALGMIAAALAAVRLLPGRRHRWAAGQRHQRRSRLDSPRPIYCATGAWPVIGQHHPAFVQPNGRTSWQRQPGPSATPVTRPCPSPRRWSWWAGVTYVLRLDCALSQLEDDDSVSVSVGLLRRLRNGEI